MGNKGRPRTGAKYIHTYIHTSGHLQENDIDEPSDIIYVVDVNLENDSVVIDDDADVADLEHEPFSTNDVAD